MSDDSDSGPIVSGEVAPAPSERPRTPVPAAPDEKSRTEQVREQFNAGLNLTAYGTEDATDYVKERKTQEKYLSDDTELSAAEMGEWHARTTAALKRAQDAAAHARGEAPQQQQQRTSQEIPGYIAPDAPDYDQHFEAAKQRFSEYFDDPNRIGDQLTAADHKANVTNWLTTYDPQSRLAGYYMGSEYGPQMAEALAAEPEAIRYLVSLPPPHQAREMAKLEGYLHARQMQQTAAQEPQPRKVSAAPPPISAPKGAANPPRDLRSLANKGESAEDYIKARRQQQRRDRERWDRD
jgi:hypothetical protein